MILTMPVYEYSALNRTGKNIKGIIDADNPQAARQKLRSSEIFPIELKETFAQPKDLPSGHISFSSFFHRVPQAEISSMTRQLATLLNAGIPLVSSLEAMIAQATNPLLKKILAEIKESVNEGNGLSFSLAKYPKYFSQVYINMVNAGEASGSLDLVLERLADFSENQEALKGRIRAAMAYPIIMCIIGILALMLLVTFVVPKFVEVFNEMEHALPLPTLIVIGASKMLKSFWWAIMIIFIAIIYGLGQFKKTTQGKRIIDKIKLGAPVIGMINIKMAMARFGRTLGSLTQSGVPLISSLQIVRNIVNNSLFADVIDNAMEEIRAGKALAVPFSRSKWVPPVVIQMITVGEHSGDLEKMLNKIADIYEREVESQIAMLTSMLEPVMILLMAVIVGFIAFSIVLPILEMSQIVH
jgi:general secretion pathway protein F